MNTSFEAGKLALQWCGKRLPLQVLCSARGHYIGTCDEDGPVSRESVEYFDSLQKAERALANNTWTQKLSP